MCSLDSRTCDELNEALASELSDLIDETDEQMASKMGGAWWSGISNFFKGKDDSAIDSALSWTASSMGKATKDTFEDAGNEASSNGRTNYGSSQDQQAGGILGAFMGADVY